MSNNDSVSLVIPVYNEGDVIEDCLRYHQSNFDFDEIVVVDGGSDDGTVEKAKSVPGEITVTLTNSRGRGPQLGKGQDVSRGRWIVMVHADSRLPPSFHLSEITGQSRRWGWFDCQLDDERLIYRMLSRSISIRSALFSTPTGDQGIWVHRDLLKEVGGIPEVPIMEDVSLVRKLRDKESGQRIEKPTITSARKWKREGIFRVILLMWFFRLAYLMGATHEWIYRKYYGTAPNSC